MTSKGFEWSNEADNYVSASTDQNDSGVLDRTDATSEASQTNTCCNGFRKTKMPLTV